MAKHRKGTIQQILRRHYAKCREQNQQPDIWERTRAKIKRRWTPERKAKQSAAMTARYDRLGRKRDQLEPKDLELAKTLQEKHTAQMDNPIWRSENRHVYFGSKSETQRYKRQKCKEENVRFKAEYEKIHPETCR